MNFTGPLALLVAWVVHDIEEAIAFPAECDRLADRAGIEFLRMGRRQSWAAVGFMGLLVAPICAAGFLTTGRSGQYRAMVAGLEGHVVTHALSAVAQRRYTAGVITALTVMWPGARLARHELSRSGHPLRPRDYFAGAMLLLPAAITSQVLVRLVQEGARAPRRHRRSSTKRFSGRRG